MKFAFYFLIIYTLISCKTETRLEKREPLLQDTIVKAVSKKIIKPISELEKRLIAAKLINIKTLDSTILVELKYSTTDNFMGIDLYGDLENAYLQPDVADKILKAQSLLKRIDSAKTLLIYDAVRPKYIQQKMWDALKMPFQEKIKFLSNPKMHSIHNYGAAVDLTIAGLDKKALDMGTPYDYIGVLAHPTKEQQLRREGKLTIQQIKNRKLLRKVMRHGGFFNIQTEWWHFNSCIKIVAKQRYRLIE